MRAHRRKLAADLKNARKKKQRLQQRARLLSTEDLLTVVALREGDNFNPAGLFSGSEAADPEHEEPAAGSEEDALHDDEQARAEE